MDTEAAMNGGSAPGDDAPALEIAGGSIAGQMHLAAGRNNQDAYCWEASPGGLVAVVCDGCGSGPHSEVGALIGARLVVRAVSRLRGSGLGSTALFDEVRQQVLAGLRAVACRMSATAPAGSGEGV